MARLVDDARTQHLLIAALLEQIQAWSARWGVPGLEKRVTLELSQRLRVSLGRARPREKLIRLNAALAEQPRSVLEEVACHEAAHIAVHELYRGYRRPHGPEWRALMRVVGFEPRARMKLAVPFPGTGPVHIWEHHCPVCQARRTARRPVRQWRCAACIGSGLSGELIITKRSARGAA